VFLDHVDPIYFLPLVTILHTFLKLNTYLDTFRIEICVWVEWLSPAVNSYPTSLTSFMMLSLACGLLRVLVFHPSRCELTVVRFDVVV
jgi:hypothetical protein